MYVRMRSKTVGLQQVEKTLVRRFGPDKFTSEQQSLLVQYLYHISAAPPCGEYALNSILAPVVSYNAVPATGSSAAVPEAPSKGGDAAASRRASSYFPPKTDVGVYAHESLEMLFRHYCVAAPPKSLPVQGMEGSSVRRGAEVPLEPTPIHFPVLVMYGDTDWLYYRGIEDSVKTWGTQPLTREQMVAHGLHAGQREKCSSKAADPLPNNPTAAPLDVTYTTIPSAGHHIYLDNPDHFHGSIAQWDAERRRKQSSTSLP